MMKLQDVLLKAMAKKSAGGLRCDHRSHGSDHAALAGALEEQGIRDWWTGARATQRQGVPLAKVEEVLRLYQEVYFQFKHAALARKANQSDSMP
jgi:hypothetical protein